MTALSIIIPCYNESQSLENLLNKCFSALDGREGIEFIFVNNGSTDNSDLVLKQLLLQTRFSFAKTIKVEVNRGYGFGIISGLKEAKGEVLAWTHADLQTDPADVIIAYEKNKPALLSEKIIVKGKRTGRPFFDMLFTAGMSLVSSLLLSTRLSDVNAQPKIFHRHFMTYMERAPFDFSLDLYILYLAKKGGYTIVPHLVHFGKRFAGEAKGGGSFRGKIKLIKRTFLYILRLRKEVKQLQY